MEDSTSTMVTNYDTFKPITKLFVQIEKGVQIYDTATTPFKIEQIIAKVYIWL